VQYQLQLDQNLPSASYSLFDQASNMAKAASAYQYAEVKALKDKLLYQDTKTQLKLNNLSGSFFSWVTVTNPNGTPPPPPPPEKAGPREGPSS
jgi:hypothetical protein